MSFHSITLSPLHLETSTVFNGHLITSFPAPGKVTRKEEGDFHVAEFKPLNTEFNYISQIVFALYGPKRPQMDPKTPGQWKGVYHRIRAGTNLNPTNSTGKC